MISPASETTALLVIDEQVGMLSEDDPADQRVLRNTAMLLERARAIGAPVLYMRHNGGTGHPLAMGTPGWEIHPAVAPRPGEPVMDKRASDSFYQTPLGQELAALGVRRLVVVGVATEHCVDATCRRALSEGYDVTLAADAHGTGGRDALDAQQVVAHHNATLATLAHPDHAVTVVPAAAITFA